MTTKRTWLKRLHIMEVPLRLLLALFIAFSSFSPLALKMNEVSAAAGSTRVMCEDDPSLVGCWRMEEGSGTLIQDGGSYSLPNTFNEGTYNGTYNSTTSWVTGKIGTKALNFDGLTNYVNVDDESSLDLTTGITLAAWIRPTKTASATQNIIKKANTTGTTVDGYEISLSSATPGLVFVRFNQKTSGDTYRINSTTSYPLNGSTWMHIAATYNGTTMKLYVNGVQEGGDKTGPTLPTGIVTNNLPLTIGQEFDGAYKFQGNIDDARVYNRALSLAEIAALASTTPPGDITPPAAPTGLTPAAGNTTVGLTWTSPTDPDVKGYNVYRGTTTPVSTTTPINGALVLTESYNDTGLTNETPYFYVVKAVDTSTNASVASDEATATPSGPVVTCYALTLGHTGNGTTPTALPENSTGCLSGSYVAGESISLSGAVADSGWAITGWTGTSNNSSTANTNSLTMPASDTSAGVIYSDVAPAAPTGLNASGGNAVVNLSWTANSEGDLAGYNLYRGTTDGGPYSLKVNSTLLTGTSTTDTGVVNGTPYYYILKAVDTSTNESAASLQATATPTAPLENALQFDGVDDYVTFGNVAGLGATNFTLETWFFWTGGGVSMTTSSSQGLPSVIPLVAKGRGEADGSNLDTNYFLGIDTTTHALAVDFEDMASGMNWPYISGTPVTINTWHHAAVTYDSVSAVYTVYLDGNVTGTSDLGSNVLPRADSIQHAGFATAMTSNGTAAGYFQGKMDEVRIWNVVRTQTELRSTINSQLSSGSGLLARWGLDEGTGLTAVSSVGTFPGTLTNGPAWITPGSPFNAVPDTTPPSAPSGLGATPGNTTVALSWTAVGGTPDLAGYNVYRSTSASVPLASPINGGTLVSGTTYNDTGRTNGQIYYYVVTAVDRNTNQSGASNEVNATPFASITCYALTLTSGINGTAPTASPTNSTGCSAGQFVASESITLTAHPNGEYQVASWTGTNNDALKTLTNTLTMPSSIRTVNVNYESIPVGNYALSFDGTNDYVTLGLASGLGLQTFTIETWLYRDATNNGKLMGTGTDGLGYGSLPQAYPVITKGRGQADTPANLNTNYWVGIASTGVIAADFEDTNDGLNHPILGTTQINKGEWHHIAITFGGGCWNLYIDGNLDSVNSLTTQCPKIRGSTTVSAIPESTSIQHAAFASALQSLGTLPSDSGFFAGKLDEVRIWNVVRTPEQIRADINNQVASGSNLVARWGLNEGSGYTINSSVGTFPGTLTPSSALGPTWVTPGAPFNIVFDTTPPAVPSGLGATPGNTTVILNWTANAETDLASYKVYRSTSPGVPLTSPIATVLKPATTYTDNGRTNGQIYYYVITALDASGNPSGASNEVNATPVGDITPPAVPTLLTATGANSMVALDWANNTDLDLAGYNVYTSSTSGGPYTKVNTTLVVPSAYTHTGLTNGSEYYYVVRAVDTSANESGNSNEGYAIPQAEAGSALQFNGTNQYAAFANGNSLAYPIYTVETWFKRTGAGVGVTTGGSGITSAIPLITKGTSESETALVDINYFLGIDATSAQLIGDFEEGAGGTTPSLNHPVTGTTVIANDVWYHAAMTYDGTTLKIYLNGKLEGSVVAGQPAASAATSPTSFATSIRSNGTTIQGYFNGVMDEARIWDVARTQNQILSTINQQITSGTGLAARWGMNEGSGTSIASSIGTFPGTLTNAPTWVPGAPFNINTSPAVPTLVAPSDLATGVSTSAALTVHVSDTQNSPLTVTFYGRPKTGTPGIDFSVIAIPDPQNYAAFYPSIYNAQMNWVVGEKTSRNIKFVMSLGDNVNTYTSSTEWTNATTAWDILTTGGVRYGIVPGNHDGAPSSTANFNTNFAARLTGAPNSCTQYGSDADNTYCTFSASGMDFIAFFIEYDNTMSSTSDARLVWANGILAANPSKRAIVVTHDLLNGNSFTTQGSTIFNALKGNSNLFLMLGGHLDTAGQRQDVGTNGNVVYSLRSDYQGMDSQQSGYLRAMRFSPVDSKIYVTTYSPNQSKSLTDTANQFSLNYSMDGVPVDFQLVGTATNVPSGSDATVTWSGLANSTDYEWYAVADNSGAITGSPTWSFTTEAVVNHAPTDITLSGGSVAENAAINTVVGTLTSTDPDAGNTFTYSLADGDGSTDNASFNISGNSLRTSASFDFESKASYSVRIQTSDQGSLTYQKAFTITVTNVNEAPVAVDDSLSTTMNTALVISAGTLKTNDTDMDNTNAELSVTAVSNPTNGAVALVSGTITFTPTADFTGTAGFDYTVSDGGLTDTGHVTVTVNASALTHNIDLVEGWNLVNFNLHPTSTAIADVLATISGKYTLVYAWNGATQTWQHYDPNVGINSLNTLDETRGFWIKMSTGGTLSITGINPGSLGIPLAEGWNLVGYPSATNGPLPGVLTSNGVTDLVLVMAYHAGDLTDQWKLFDPNAEPYASDLSALEPGWGYWIQVGSASTWNISYVP